MNQKIIIGLLGEKGGGKGTFTSVLKEFLSDKNIESIRSRDILGDILDILGLEASRENFQKLAPALRDNLSPDIITKAVKKRLENSGADIVIFDGVRWQPDVDLVRSFPKNYLVYITADPQIRYERTKLRKEKVGEDLATYDQFLEEEKAETEKYIKEIGAAADLIITNNSSFDNFKEQINNFSGDYLQ